MILTITPNPTIDRTYSIADFTLNQINVPALHTTVAGGKGINVARILRTLGAQAVAGGFAGGKTGSEIEAMLQEEEISHEFTHVSKESRHCIKIMDSVTGTQTEINEPGPLLTPAEVDSLLDYLESNITRFEAVAVSGSVPPGAPDNLCARIVEISRSHGVFCLLDTAGVQLEEAVKQSPNALKPNQHELAALLDREISTFEDAVSGALELIKTYDISVVAVTLGKQGAAVTDGKHVYAATPPEIVYASSVGSGDSFAAGLLYSLLRGEPLSQATALATAAGAANAATYSSGFCTRCSIMELLDKVSVETVS